MYKVALFSTSCCQPPPTVTQGLASLQRIAMTFFDRSKWDGQEVVDHHRYHVGKSDYL